MRLGQAGSAEPGGCGAGARRRPAARFVSIERVREKKRGRGSSYPIRFGPALAKVEEMQENGSGPTVALMLQYARNIGVFWDTVSSLLLRSPGSCYVSPTRRFYTTSPKYCGEKLPRSKHFLVVQVTSANTAVASAKAATDNLSNSNAPSFNLVHYNFNWHKVQLRNIAR